MRSGSPVPTCLKPGAAKQEQFQRKSCLTHIALMGFAKIRACNDGTAPVQSNECPEPKPVSISGRVFKNFLKDHEKFVLKSSDLSFIYRVSCVQPYLDRNYKNHTESRGDSVSFNADESISVLYQGK